MGEYEHRSCGLFTGGADVKVIDFEKDISILSNRSKLGIKILHTNLPHLFPRQIILMLMFP
jgi:hypothetical protein